VSPISFRHLARSCAILVQSANVVAILLFLRAFFSVRPQVMSGHPLGRGCATHPVRSFRGSRAMSIRARWPAQRNNRIS